VRGKKRERPQRKAPIDVASREIDTMYFELQRSEREPTKGCTAAYDQKYIEERMPSLDCVTLSESAICSMSDPVQLRW
jgi:hypothetical protein